MTLSVLQGITVAFNAQNWNTKRSSPPLPEEAPPYPDRLVARSGRLTIAISWNGACARSTLAGQSLVAGPAAGIAETQAANQARAIASGSRPVTGWLAISVMRWAKVQTPPGVPVAEPSVQELKVRAGSPITPGSVTSSVRAGVNSGPNTPGGKISILSVPAGTFKLRLPSSVRPSKIGRSVIRRLRKSSASLTWPSRICANGTGSVAA